MSGRKPGPTCSASHGKHWIDRGTSTRWRSHAPGPLGLLLPLIMGAAPVSAEADAGAQIEEDKSAAQGMIDYDIGIIADSPFGKTAEGKDIVKLLRALNSNGKIVYAATVEDGRGDWDGEIIRVSENYRGKMFPTVIELVHEGTHALWRKKHPFRKGSKPNREQNIADELHAQENQLLMYKYLKEKKGCPDDSELELRLQRQANGELRKTIEERFVAP
ncbi:MAG: hypothetical protein JWL63_626 [Rhodocyclales bacterium]|nr:hypothetical protein [Rhodocyclales bacterium]